MSQSIFNAQLDLNPHQVEAALFAFKSPLSSGVILADEVLGSIEKELKDTKAKEQTITTNELFTIQWEII